MDMLDRSQQSTINRRTFWLSIIASIIASILFSVFFQPIVTWISNIVVSTIGVFYVGYIDSLYNKAAQSPTDYLIFMVFWIVAGFPIIIITTIIIALGLISLMRKASEPNKRRMSTVFSIFAAVGLIGLLIIVAGPAVSIRANATFQRRLMALTPVIDDNERKSLLGEWAIMKSKVEYESINKRMDALAKKYHVEIPPQSE